ncbi:MAG: ABC transporter permease [Nitrospirae bacterium]|jgi:putative ABC transport system permease protein|nr:ABC transporter permease [Nitrospirota bacterium]
MERLIKIILQSIKAVRAFKLRTFFCLLSVALGIASITVIVAATEGAYKKAFEIVERFGPDSLLVFGGGQEARAVGQRQKTITLDDIEAVKEAFDSAYLLVPMSTMRDVTVSYRDKKYQTRIVGSTSDYSRMWTWPVIQGSDFKEEDVKGLRNVGLIGQFVAKELFGDEDPVGKYILVRRIPVQIVGVLSERGTTPAGEPLDDRIVIPISTLMRKLQNETKYVSAFRIRFYDQENLYHYKDELGSFLRKRHKIPPEEPDDFTIVSPKEVIQFLVALTGSLVAFLGVTGIISLIVAGFVLANLFLLSVKERTAEIGIRRATGAKKRDILMQFLGESVTITTLGGFLGFLLALLASKLLILIAQFPIYFSWKAFVTGLLLSWIVGIVFGLQPANRAANLKPIEAIKG